MCCASENNITEKENSIIPSDKKINAFEPQSETEFSIWGKPGADGLYLGMWSFHLSILIGEDAHEEWEHALVAAAYRGFILGTFVNSFNQRCYVFGVHRTLFYSGDSSGFSTDFGYNLGVVHGYDGRLVSIAEQIRFFPFLQVTYDIAWKWFGIQFSYVGVVLSVGFFMLLDF